jgi:hypothetical protein
VVVKVLDHMVNQLVLVVQEVVDLKVVNLQVQEQLMKVIMVELVESGLLEEVLVEEVLVQLEKHGMILMELVELDYLLL